MFVKCGGISKQQYISVSDKKMGNQAGQLLSYSKWEITLHSCSSCLYLLKLWSLGGKNALKTQWNAGMQKSKVNWPRKSQRINSVWPNDWNARLSFKSSLLWSWSHHINDKCMFTTRRCGEGSKIISQFSDPSILLYRNLCLGREDI